MLDSIIWFKKKKRMANDIIGLFLIRENPIPISKKTAKIAGSVVHGFKRPVEIITSCSIDKRFGIG